MLEKKYSKNKHSDIFKELESFDNSLSNIDFDISHQVPEGFWQQQEKEIFNRLDSTSASRPKHIRILPWIAGIAAAVLVLILFTFPVADTGELEKEFLEDVEFSVIEEYILDEAGLLYDSGELDNALLAIDN